MGNRIGGDDCVAKGNDIRLRVVFGRRSVGEDPAAEIRVVGGEGAVDDFDIYEEDGKILSIRMTADKLQELYISDLDDAIVRQMHMLPAHSIGEALKMAEDILGKKDMQIVAIPDGVSVIVRKKDNAQ